MTGALCVVQDTSRTVIAATVRWVRMAHLVSVVMADDRPIAWLALQEGTAIVGSDGEQIGKVGEVIADREKDIFSGITFKPGLMEAALFIPVDKIGDLTDTEVTLTIPASEAASLEQYDT